MKRAPFIWIQEQVHDKSYDFRKLVSQGPHPRTDGENRWFLFRRKFEIKDDLISAITKVTVDGRYQLFVNRSQVCRGPIRCNPQFQRYDQIDLAPFLKSGTNVIGLLIHVYGKDTAWYQQSLDYWQTIFGDGGLYFDASLQYKNKQHQLKSDPNWKYITAESWDQQTPPSGWGQDFIERFDANKFPINWLAENFDDSHWKTSVELIHRTSENEKRMGWGNIQPFPIMVKNSLPPLVNSIANANRIISAFKVVPNLSLAFNQRIYQEDFIPAEPAGIGIVKLKNLLLNDDQTTRIKTNGENDVAFVIQFENLETGCPFIELTAEGGELIEVAVSEKLPGEYSNEGIQENRIRIGTHLDCQHMFQYRARKGTQRFEKFEWTAVRYMVVVIRNARKGLKIKHIGVSTNQYPLTYQGRFNCSDPLLNQLWKTGANTILKCSHDAWEDCPSREKRQWIGDGFVRYPASLVCFGTSGLELDKLYLQQAAESQRNDGLLQMFAPGDHHYNGIVIPDFSLHWISCLYQFLWFTNDLSTVASHYSTLDKIINWYCLQINSNGMLSDIPHWQFVEWANIERTEQPTTINAMFAGALKQSAFIANQIGYQSAAEKFLALFEQIKLKLNAEHWDPARGIYIDSIHPTTGQKSRQVSQHANAQMIVHDIAPKKRWNGIIKYITDPQRTKLTATPPVVKYGETVNLETDVIKCNTSFAHFLYASLAKTGNFHKAIDLFRENYAPMLASGTTTLWESFSPDASLCHAFSASPVYYLSKEILGVTPLCAGFTKVSIQPNVCDLDFAEGCYPTIHGNILVNWRKTDKGLHLELDIPEKIEATLQISSTYGQPDQSTKTLSGKQKIAFTVTQ